MKTITFKKLILGCFCLITFLKVSSQVLVEAESFTNKGGWVIDQQFITQMGSPYIMAHGMGIPVSDATTKVILPKPGKYRIFIRTYNWTSPWYKGKGPGKFTLKINNTSLDQVFGESGYNWQWEKTEPIEITSSIVNISLHDLTGFNGRCDAILFSSNLNYNPPTDSAQLNNLRNSLKLHSKPLSAGKFDLVIVGGGMAGTCAAIAAARLGVKVALIQDRPILGGNNSSEVRVGLGGKINLGLYPKLGDIVNELDSKKPGNAQPANNYDDQKKSELVKAEKNITLFLNYHANQVIKKGTSISKIIAKQIETGKELSFSAPLFADCTGDGTIGFMAGATFMMGRESKDQFGESMAPDKSDKLTMGASVQWYSEDKTQAVNFPKIDWGISFNEKSAQKLDRGDWTWETGMNFNQIKDFERIRDYGLLAIFSNWSFLKNEYSKSESFKTKALSWVAFVSGKRESRRLIGDYILREQDIRNKIIYPDASVTSTWAIDLHYPDPENTKYFPNQEFLSIAKFKDITPYPIPYRCLYSKDVDNLFMAGRNISVTHIALGTVRVMRTGGMMGEVVGMAASICKQHHTNPRGVYQQFLESLKSLMKQGVGKNDLKK
ncbi:MAG: FAD-dependent oxidoreductase [Bacteroidetes bacterium]|nr:FAD-dependent oxidoreductase [Bacteroidota bacterium]